MTTNGTNHRNEGDSSESDDDAEKEFALITKDGTVRMRVDYFNKLGRRVGTDDSKTPKKNKDEIVWDRHPWQTVDMMKYKISVGVSLDEEGNRMLSFFFRGQPIDKLDDWYCFIDCELKLLNPNGGSPIKYSDTTVITASVADKIAFGWPNFATWDEVEARMDNSREGKNSITVEVVIRNQILFRVCEKQSMVKEPIPTRRHLDQFVRPLFNSTDLADVFFQVEEDQIPAHRLVLAAKSRVFKTLLYKTKEFDRVIDLKKENLDVTKPGLLSLLKFYYRSELVVNDSILADVYFAGKLFKNDAVKETSLLFVRDDFSNVAPTLSRASKLKCHKMVTKCWQVIRSDPIAFLQSDYFLNCEPDQLKRLIVSDELSAPESIIFRQVKAWAKKRWQKENDAEEPQPADLRVILGEKIYLIRFPIIKPEKLAHILEKNPGLFSKRASEQLERLRHGEKAENIEDLLFSSRKRKPVD